MLLTHPLCLSLFRSTLIHWQDFWAASAHRQWLIPAGQSLSSQRRGRPIKTLEIASINISKNINRFKKKIFFFFLFFWLFMFTCVWWSYLYSMIDTAVIFDWLSSTPFLQWICFVFERVGGSSHGKLSCFIRLLTSDVNATFQSSWAFTALLNRLAQVDYNWINQRGEMQSGRLSCRLIIKAWSRLSQSKSLFIGWISWADNER